MDSLDLGALPAWLRRQRWFGGKGAEIASVRVVDEANIGESVIDTATRLPSFLKRSLS